MLYLTTHSTHFIDGYMAWWTLKTGNALFNDTLNTFYWWLYGVVNPMTHIPFEFWMFWCWAGPGGCCHQSRCGYRHGERTSWNSEGRPSTSHTVAKSTIQKQLSSSKQHNDALINGINHMTAWFTCYFHY